MQTATRSAEAPARPVGAAQHSPFVRSRADGVALVVVAALLVTSLALPWWSQTELFGGLTMVQSYSLLSGVTGTCTPECIFGGGGPGGFPVNGSASFASQGMGAVEALYLAEGAAVATAVALSLVAGIGALRAGGRTESASRWRRGALLAVGAGTGLLPVLQPVALEEDVFHKFASPDPWTPSVSPETSFWGGCTRGFDGFCSSGASSVWGPDIGWYLLLAAFVVAVGLELAVRRRARRPAEPPAPAPPSPS